MDLLQLALDCGAYKADYLTQNQVVLSAAFRPICENNSCGQYGKTYMCPPAVGVITDLMDQVRQYDRAMLYQTVGQLEDSFDYEGMMEAGIYHIDVCQRIQNALQRDERKLLHIAGGGCHLCSRCAIQDDQPCRYPEQALGSMSAYGVDVYSTCRNTTLHYINGQNTVTYFGMVLFSEYI